MRASVPSQKFLFTLGLYGDGASAEPLDAGQDVVGGLGPAEGLRVCVASVDVGGDRRLQLRRGAVCAAPDLLLGQQREEPLGLVVPGRGGRREVGAAAGP